MIAIGFDEQGNEIVLPVGDVTEKETSVGLARQNVSQLILDAGLELADVEVERHPEDDDDGRYCFLLIATGSDNKEYRCEVDMPGVDLSKVRYTGADDQDIFEFPRVWLNGSSWIWSVAKGILGRELDGFYAREAEREEAEMLKDSESYE